jgi:hypothetical protein
LTIKTEILLIGFKSLQEQLEKAVQLASPREVAKIIPDSVKEVILEGCDHGAKEE